MMALTELNFTATGERYVSDVYTPSTSNMAFGVKFVSTPGAVVVEHSIDGVNWVIAGAIASAANDSMYVLRSVFGFVVGEVFRVIATEAPESIHVLE
jgi:hypothetical protein